MNFANLKDVDSDTPQHELPGSVAPDAGHEGGGGYEGQGMDDADFVASEKKPINKNTLMLMTIILIGGAGTYFMYLKTGPASAKAADPAAVTAEVAINDFMKGGRGNITLLRRLLDGTARVVEQFKDYTNVAQVPLGDLKANPFKFALARQEPKEDPEEIAKRRREEQHAAAVKAAQALQLQTVLVRGNRKACMINNTMYTEGETVDGLIIEKIEPNLVTVRSGQFHVQLKMATK
jgi:hypothetical protein